MLSVLLLGSPQLLLDGQPLNVTRRKSRAVLYFLAAHAQPVTRDRLLTFFWPDRDRSAAQQVLRTTLHGLRKVLGAALLIDDNSIALAPDTEVDAHKFEATLHAQRVGGPTTDLQSLTSTLGLYRGDFLSDFALPDTPAFDDWVAAQQEYYRRLAVRGLIVLSNWHESRQDFDAALDALDRALAFDPLQEDLQRTALRLHYLAGDRAGAIRRYEHLRQLLDQEMGVPPMVETRALYDAIVNDRLPAIGGQQSMLGAQRSAASDRHGVAATFVPRPHEAPTALPFIGRDVELQALSAAAASHQLAVIEGEPGIGKTRLAEKFIHGQNGIALIGTARELEHTLPYQPVIELLRDLTTHPEWPVLRSSLNLADVWLAEIGRLLPELTDVAEASSWNVSIRQAASTSTAADESRLWESLSQFLLALSAQRHVVFFIDDVQWADASTLALLGYLVRSGQAARASIAYVAAARPVDIRSPLATLLQTLAREGRLARLPLDRLTPGEMTALAQQISPTYAYPLADWLTRLSEGNPYIVSELIHHARDNGVLQPDGTLNLDALSTSPVVPQSIYGLIQSRLSRLSDAARRILDAGVAVGRVFEFEVVARAAALSESAALDALDELRAARLIEPIGSDGLHYTFDHNLTMEVAYREVGEPRHRRLHRRVADAMESMYRNQIDGVAGLLAWHFSEGGDRERAAPYALRAAKVAEDLAAWQEAIGFYRQGLDADLNDERRASILMSLGEVYFRAGESAQAIEAYRAALAIGTLRGSDLDAARLALAEALMGEARFAEAIALAQQVRDAGQPESAINAELQWGALLSVEGADLIGASAHLQNAAALCAAQADPARLAHIKFEQGSVAAQQGDLERAVALYRETLAIADTGTREATAWQILGRNNLAYHLHLLGDPAAIEYAQAGLRLTQDKGVLSPQPFLLSTLGEIMLARRDLAAAEKYFNEGLALAERLNMPERITGLTANLGLVARERGETALAIHRLSTALARADGLGLKHLGAQIRLWLVPLLPLADARIHLAEARAMAESSGRKRLLEEAARLEKQGSPDLGEKSGSLDADSRGFR